MPLSMSGTEKREKVNTRDITLAAMATAVLFAAKEAMAALPNIEPVTLLLLVYTVIFGRRTLWIIAAFVVLEGAIYPMGTWWVMYLYVWPIWYVLVRVMARLRPSPLLWACAAGGYGLAFGALCIPTHVLFHGVPGAFGWWIAGIPMDLLHGAGNFCLTLVLYRPLLGVTERAVRGGRTS